MVAFPIVVTSAPLFECYLQEDGEKALREIERRFLFLQQRIGSTPHVKFAVVTEKGLAAHIEECTRASDMLMALFNPADDQAWEEFTARVGRRLANSIRSSAGGAVEHNANRHDVSSSLVNT